MILPAVVACLCAFVAASAQRVEVHVDAAAGEAGVLRALHSVEGGKGGAVVLAPGTYRLSAPLRITANMSGTTIASSTGRAADVRFLGSVAVGPWRRQSRDGDAPDVYAATLPAGAVDEHGFLWQLFVNGERRGAARSSTMNYDSVNASGIVCASATCELPRNLSRPLSAAFVLYESWVSSTHAISAYDPASGVVTALSGIDISYAQTPASGHRFHLAHAPELLAPGTFALDGATGEVLYMPLEGEDMTTAQVEVPVINELLVAAGDYASGEFVDNVVVANVSFMYGGIDMSSCLSGTCSAQSGDFLTDAAVHLNGARNWVLSGVVVGHVGSYGVWFDMGTSNSTLMRSHVFDLGGGGVRMSRGISGKLPDERMAVRENSVTDCLLEDGGYVIEMGCGVLAQQVSGANVQHNEIRYFHYTGAAKECVRVWGVQECVMMMCVSVLWRACDGVDVD
jgi:hypothetical protein